MAKGDSAKLEVLNKIQSSFGKNFITGDNKKIYLWASDGGEMVQICLTMSCPKTQIEAEPILNFTDDVENDTALIQDTHSEITDEEKANIAKLMKKLGL